MKETIPLIVETIGGIMTNTVTYTHTPNWYCLNIGCQKCPYRRGYMCFYGNNEYKRKVIMNDRKTIYSRRH